EKILTMPGSFLDRDRGRQVLGAGDQVCELWVHRIVLQRLFIGGVFKRFRDWRLLTGFRCLRGRFLNIGPARLSAFAVLRASAILVVAMVFDSCTAVGGAHGPQPSGAAMPNVASSSAAT